MSLYIFIITIFLMMVSLIKFPKLHIFKKNIQTHWLIIITGAFFTVIFGVVHIDDLLKLMFSDSSMNPVKLVILFIFLTIISLFLDEVGLFKFLSYKVIDWFKDSQIKVFIAVYFLTGILTVFTSNDVVILTLTPFVIYFSKHVKINPIPYLFSILTASNTFSIILIIGNPTNIYIASTLNVDFFEYLKVMFLPGLVAGFMGFFMNFFVFRKLLKQPMEKVDGAVKLLEPKLVIVSSIILLMTIVLMSISNFIKLEMWLITIIMGIVLTVFAFIYLKVKKLSLSPLIQTYKRAPWNFIPMVLGMFILIVGLLNDGYIEMLNQFLSNLNPVFGYGLTSHILSNALNNQPLSILFAEALKSVSAEPYIYSKVFASIIGTNTAVLFTPFGALAGLMWFDILKENEVDMNFKIYFKYMIPIGTVIVISSLAMLYIMV